MSLEWNGLKEEVLFSQSRNEVEVVAVAWGIEVQVKVISVRLS